jgi:hypothetical protein
MYAYVLQHTINSERTLFTVIAINHLHMGGLIWAILGRALLNRNTYVHDVFINLQYPGANPTTTISNYNASVALG